MTTIPFGDPGVAAFQTDGFDGPMELLAGDTPPWADESYVVANGEADMELYTVVGFDANGGVVLPVTGSVDPNDDIKPVGFTAAKFVDADGVKKVKVCRQAHVFIDALIWPASFGTDALRMAAFEGAPSPTNILTKKHPWAAAVS